MQKLPDVWRRKSSIFLVMSPLGGKTRCFHGLHSHNNNEREGSKMPIAEKTHADREDADPSRSKIQTTIIIDNTNMSKQKDGIFLNVTKRIRTNSSKKRKMSDGNMPDPQHLTQRRYEDLPVENLSQRPSYNDDSEVEGESDNYVA